MDIEKTYCNPIPLPDYPIGRNCYIEGKTRMDYRETADPTVLYENDEYAIVKPNTKYGLSVYDYIVLDAGTVRDDQFINQK